MVSASYRVSPLVSLFVRIAVPRRAFVAFCLFVLPATVRAQNLPSFCEQVTQDELAGLPHPYTTQQTADHASYCEGMLTSAVAVHPVEIVSAKYGTAADFKFTRGTATLSWCRLPEVDLSTHLSLRAIKPASYALDAQAADRFTWSSNLAALLHPDYESIAALATSSATVQTRRYNVLLPVRPETQANRDYVFIVYSAAPQIQLVEANVENLTGTINKTLPIRLQPGPAHYWTVELSLGTLPSGIYRLYFRDDPKASGLVSTPIYFAHGGCS